MKWIEKMRETEIDPIREAGEDTLEEGEATIGITSKRQLPHWPQVGAGTRAGGA